MGRLENGVAATAIHCLSRCVGYEQTALGLSTKPQALAAGPNAANCTAWPRQLLRGTALRYHDLERVEVLVEGQAPFRQAQNYDHPDDFRIEVPYDYWAEAVVGADVVELGVCCSVPGD